MKRTLRQSKGDRLKNEEAKLNGSQKQQYDALKNMAKQYEGKSDSEIFSELSKTVEKGKRDGSITDEKINSIAQTIAPMLSGEQKQKLDVLMRSLKR